MEQLNPIVPFQFFPDRHEAMLAAMRELNSRFGIRRFLLTGPGLGVRLTGFPEPAVYQQIGELVLRVKNALLPLGVEIGWWCTPTLKSGRGSFQNIVGLDGLTAAISGCPLDLAFRSALAGGMAAVAAIARPFMLLLEDDFQVSFHPGADFGCFCPLHLAQFANRMGRVYPREELAELFRKRTPESQRLRHLWSLVSRDSLVQLAADIEQAVHVVSPETRLGLAQCAHDAAEGDFSAAVVQALAGSNRPLVRVHGANYASDTARDLPSETFEVMHSCEHLPETFEVLIEGDTYPHTTFFTSAAKLQSMIAIALSCGCHDTLFYATQYLDDPLEDSSYLTMYKNHERQFSAWRNAVRASHLTGCEILYRPAAANAVPWKSGTPRSHVPWPGVLGRYGVPHTSRSGAGVKVLSGETAAVLTEAEIQTIFSGGILMDGSAAHILSERGYDNLLGASVQPGGQAAFCYERLRANTLDTTTKGELIYNFLFAPAGAEGGSFFRLIPHAGSEVLSDFLDPSYSVVQPGMLRFENSLGGRVGIIAFDLQRTQSSAIFCYRKKNALVRLLEWLNRQPLPVTVVRDPNIFLLANQSGTNDLFLTVINLSADRRSRLTLSFADKWAAASVHRLSITAQWEPLAAVWDKRQLELALELSIMQPEYLRICTTPA